VSFLYICLQPPDNRLRTSESDTHTAKCDCEIILLLCLAYDDTLQQEKRDIPFPTKLNININIISCMNISICMHMYSFINTSSILIPRVRRSFTLIDSRGINITMAFAVVRPSNAAGCHLFSCYTIVMKYALMVCIYIEGDVLYMTTWLIINAPIDCLPIQLSISIVQILYELDIPSFLTIGVFRVISLILYICIKGPLLIDKVRVCF
jgi:hypothetical protein